MWSSSASWWRPSRNLDGVRVFQGVFNDENVFILSGEQDHEGQAERIVALARTAAKSAWPDLPPPSDIRASTFAIRPLRPLLDSLNRKLPNYSEADQVILTRAYYDADSALVLAGLTTDAKSDYKELKTRIESLIDADPKPVVKLSLTPQPIDRDVADRTVARGVEALAQGNIASFGHDDLDQAIMFIPSNSTAWFVRAAHYHAVGERELALRDLRRVRLLEKVRGTADRNGALQRFQGPLRQTLEDMLTNVKTAL